MSILFLILAVFFCRVILGIPTHAILLTGLGLIAFAILIYQIDKSQKKVMVDSIVKVELLRAIPVYLRKVECTGFSLSVKSSSRYQYEYSDVLDHYEYLFWATYKDGTKGKLKCNKDSHLYKQLIAKCDK